MKKKYIELVLPLESALGLQKPGAAPVDAAPLGRLAEGGVQPGTENSGAGRGGESPSGEKLGGEKLGRDDWLEQWSCFLQSRGKDTKWPCIAGRTVDLYTLYYMVDEQGGIDEVSRRRRWREVARRLGFLPGASGTVKHHYVRQLLSFSNYLSGVNEDAQDGMVFDPLDTPNNLLLAECKHLSETLAAEGLQVEGSIKAATSYLQSLAIGSPLPGTASVLASEPPPGVPRDENAREGRGPAGEDAELTALEALLQGRADRAAALDVAGVKLTDRVKKVLRAPLKPPVPVGDASARGANRGARAMVPLYRQGATLFCQGDFVTINSEEESDVPFMAQLLSYDREQQQLEVRWLYRCEEVQTSAPAALQRYRRKHFPSDDVAVKDSQWNGEHEIFFSFHTDTGVHINSVIGQVSVFFLEGYPLDAPVRLGRGEYFCRSVWDPIERSIYYFGEKDFKNEMRRVIDDEVQFSPYPYPQLPSMQEQVLATSVAGMASGPASASATAGAPGKQMPQHHLHTLLTQEQQQHAQALASAMTGWHSASRPPEAPAANAKNAVKRRAYIKMGSHFDDIPSLGRAHQDWVSPEVDAMQWSKRIKSSSTGDGVSMDGDFEIWHAHMRALWQRQAVTREEKRQAAFRTPRQRQHDSALEERAQKLDEARTSRVAGKLKAAMSAAKGVGGSFSLSDQGRDAATAVGQRLAGSLPVTWTVSMMRDDATSTLRVLYRPPKAPDQQPVPPAQAVAHATHLKDGERTTSQDAGNAAQPEASFACPAASPAAAGSQPAVVTLNSVTQVQKYLSDEYARRPSGAEKRVLARSFLGIESMLHHEIAERRTAALQAEKARNQAEKARNKAAASARPQHKVDEALIDETRECLMMLEKRKMEFEKQLKEAEDWRACLLQSNAQLKQAVRCVQPTKTVIPVPGIQSSHCPAPPYSRTVVDQRSGRVFTEYPMDKKGMPVRSALGTFRRAARALDRKHAQAHSGEASCQRWTRLKLSCTEERASENRGRQRLGISEQARWKPRFGRFWWEASLRQRALSKPAVVNPNRPRLDHQDSGTETDIESENEDAKPEKLNDLPRDALPKTPLEYVGQRVQRCSLDAQGRPVAAAIAVVVAYLPAAQTGFISSQTGLPSGLWRIKFHDSALGEEELEHDELVDAYLAYRSVSSLATLQSDADRFLRKINAPWRVSGHPLIGRLVRRGIVDRHSQHTAAGRLAGFVDGTIRAWLPPEASNYFSHCASDPQALFRVVYHCKEIGMEDLNLEEVQESIAAYVPCNAPARSDEWLPYGNAYVGKRIRRSVMDPGGRMSAVDGMVRGWLPAELSNFVSEQTGRPAALWRVVYDHVGIGQEDLEDFEVDEAVQVYQNEVLLTSAHPAPQGAGAAQPNAGAGELASAPLGEATMTKGIGAGAYDEWWTSGNAFVGRRVRRFILNELGQMVNTADAVIRGWLPSQVSNFVDERTGEMAPLWRIRYDDTRIGEEDLELSEVEEAIELYGKDTKAPSHHSPQTSDPSAPQQPPSQQHVLPHQPSQQLSQPQPKPLPQAQPTIKSAPEQQPQQPAKMPQADKPQTDNVHDASGGDEWLKQGHAFIGKRVRRRILDAEQAGHTAASDVDGTVVGWLPAHMSNYFKDDDPGQPAALWRVQYDDPAIGQEDLEESEVTDAAAMFSAHARPSRSESLPIKEKQAQPNAVTTPQERSPKKNQQHVWRSEGNALIGKRVRRSYLDGEQKLARFVHGTVKSWVSADHSDYISESTGQAAPLWLVVYDDEGIGEEELEAAEVEEGMLAYERQFGGERECESGSSGGGADASQMHARAGPVHGPGGASSTGDGARAQDASCRGATELPHDEWMTTGSKYLRQRVRRSVSVVATAAEREAFVMLDGTITGWLPAEKSNFFKDPETELEPAALWRCSFDDLRAGEADLEEEEVLHGMREYETNQKRGRGTGGRGEVRGQGEARGQGESRGQPRGQARRARGGRSAGAAGAGRALGPKSGSVGRDAVAENSGQDHAWLQTGSEHLCKNVRAHGAVGQVTAWRAPDSSPPSAGLLPLLLALACCIHIHACEHT